MIENVGGKLKDAATRCVLRPVDVSKCVCGSGAHWGSLQHSPVPLTRLGRGMGK